MIRRWIFSVLLLCFLTEQCMCGIKDILLLYYNNVLLITYAATCTKSVLILPADLP